MKKEIIDEFIEAYLYALEKTKSQETAFKILEQYGLTTRTGIMEIGKDIRMKERAEQKSTEKPSDPQKKFFKDLQEQGKIPPELDVETLSKAEVWRYCNQNSNY